MSRARHRLFDAKRRDGRYAYMRNGLLIRAWRGKATFMGLPSHKPQRCAQ